MTAGNGFRHAKLCNHMSSGGAAQFATYGPPPSAMEYDPEDCGIGRRAYRKHTPEVEQPLWNLTQRKMEDQNAITPVAAGPRTKGIAFKKLGCMAKRERAKMLDTFNSVARRVAAGLAPRRRRGQARDAVGRLASGAAPLAC